MPKVCPPNPANAKEIEPVYKTPEVMDGSFTRDVLRCKRYAYYSHILGLKSLKPQVALDFGTAMHKMVEIWYTCNKTESSVETAQEWADENYTLEKEGDTRTLGLLKERFVEYTEKYQTEPYETLDVEIGFAVPMTSDIVWGGRVDRVIRWSDGGLYLADTKTSKRIGTYWYKRFHPHLSITGYIWGLAQYYQERIEGLLIDGVSSAKNPRDKFWRDIENRTPQETEDFEVTVQATFYDWKGRCEMCRNGADPLQVFYKEPYTCDQYAGCPYRRLCISGADEGLMKRFYKIDRWHPYKDLAEHKQDKEPKLHFLQSRNKKKGRTLTQRRKPFA